MMFLTRPIRWLLFMSWLQSGAASAAGHPSLVVRPPASLENASPAVFYQAVPLAAGELWLQKPVLSQPDAKSLVVLKPVAYWPDGSVRWLGAEGTLQKPPAGAPVSLTIAGKAPARERDPHQIAWSGDQVTLRDARGNVLLSLTPEASWVPVTKAKEPQPDDPDDLDSKGQYSWAVPIDELTDSPTPNPVVMQVREGTVEEENRVYTIYRIRGSGVPEKGAPGDRIEWQLRLRCYHQTPLVRAQMTWVLGCDANRYALTSALLRMEVPGGVKSAAIGGEEAVRLGSNTVAVVSDVTGANRLAISGRPREASESATPLAERGVALLEGRSGFWAVAVPDLNQMGPNHLLISREGVELASWSEASGLGFDLRRSSGSEGDFGMRSVDMNVNGTGFARTTEFALIRDGDPQTVRELALREARREWIWLPSAADLERTAALGPFSTRAITENRDYFDGLSANLHFVLASRERWRWKGYANFGDWRTNFARGTVPARGLTAGRWALSGRYGWRNGSGEPYASVLTAALFLDDRQLALAAFDYARHVADVDVRHGSFWKALQGDEGGMHRRNRDHWSGSTQMQYTTSRGLYLASWLTGDRRLGDVLGEIRDYGKRPNRQIPALSYGARSWIHRYMETRDPEDLATARALLDQAAAYWAAHGSWAEKSPDHPLGSIYFQSANRRVGEGIGTLIDFHQATGERIYLESLLEAARNDGEAPLGSPMLGHPFLLGYLLSCGVPPAEIGEPLLRRARAAVAGFQPGEVPEFGARDYETLATVVTEKFPPSGSPAYRETNAIRERANAAFLALQFFGNGAPSYPPEPVRKNRERSPKEEPDRVQ